MKLKFSIFYRNIYYVLIIGLIVFGVSFSKFQVIGPLHLHDFFLLSGTLLIFLGSFRILSFPGIVILGCISIVYLIISLFISHAPFEIIIRQYALFGYMTCFYLLFINASDLSDYNVHIPFLIRVSLFCVGIQTVFIIYRVVMRLSVTEDYNYYSPATVLGIIIGAAYAIVFSRQFLWKGFLFFLILILSTTTGHSSAFLSVFTVGAFYLFFRTTNKSKMIIIVLIIIAVFTLYIFLPQFQDVNAGWRLITWSHTIQTIVVENYGVLGEGFGVPYFDAELIQRLYNEVGSTSFFGPERIYEPYLSSVHNSFLTIFFSIGLLPGLLILYPFYKMIKYLANRRKRRSDGADFLFLSLIGISVWISFNQILEIPHSTALFWLVYFSCMLVPVKDEEN